MINKYKLAEYLDFKHEQSHGIPSNRTWLHKALYFTYALWVTSAHKVNNVIEGSNEFKDFELLPLSLFDAEFRAWAYGPVEFDIYQIQKSKGEIRYKNKKSIQQWYDEQFPIVWQLLDPHIEVLLTLNSFQLTAMSKDDSVWLDNYRTDILFSDLVIPNESIQKLYKKSK